MAEAKASGGFVGVFHGHEEVIHPEWVAETLDSVVKARQGNGAPTAADSAALRQALPGMIEARRKARQAEMPDSNAGPTQCHDITVYPAIGLAGGACSGYGMLLDIKDPVHPKRLDAAADPTSPTGTRPPSTTTGTRSCSPMNGAAGCSPSAGRPTRTSGAPTPFHHEANRKLQFQSYYKLPAPQTPRRTASPTTARSFRFRAAT